MNTETKSKRVLIIEDSREYITRILRTLLSDDDDFQKAQSDLRNAIYPLFLVTSADDIEILVTDNITTAYEVICEYPVSLIFSDGDLRGSNSVETLKAITKWAEEGKLIDAVVVGISSSGITNNLICDAAKGGRLWVTKQDPEFSDKIKRIVFSNFKNDHKDWGKVNEEVMIKQTVESVSDDIWIGLFESVKRMQKGVLELLASEKRPEIKVSAILKSISNFKFDNQNQECADIQMPTVEAVIELYKSLMELGGNPGHFPDTELKIKTAVEKPNQSVFGTVTYPTVFLKVSAFAHVIAREHPFSDGNKRLCWSGTVGILIMSGIRFPEIRELGNDADEAHSVVWYLASGDFSLEDFAKWLEVKCLNNQK